VNERMTKGVGLFFVLVTLFFSQVGLAQQNTVYNEEREIEWTYDEWDEELSDEEWDMIMNMEFFEDLEFLEEDLEFLADYEILNENKEGGSNDE